MILFFTIPILLTCSGQIRKLMSNATIDWKVKALMMSVMAAKVLFIMTLSHNTWSYVIYATMGFDTFNTCKSLFSALYFASQAELIPLIIYAIIVYESIKDGMNRLRMGVAIHMLALSWAMSFAYVMITQVKQYAIDESEYKCFDYQLHPPFIGSRAMAWPITAIFITSTITFSVRTCVYIGKKKITKYRKIYEATLSSILYFLIGALIYIASLFFPLTANLIPVKPYICVTAHYKSVLWFTKGLYILFLVLMMLLIKPIRDKVFLVLGYCKRRASFNADE